MVELIQLILDSDLSHGPRLLAIVIANGINGKNISGGYWGSIPRLARQCGYDRRTVFRNLQALEREGLLSIEGRAGRSSIYRLNTKALLARTGDKLSPPVIDTRDKLSPHPFDDPSTSPREASSGDIGARTGDISSPTHDKLPPQPVTNCHPEPEVEPVIESEGTGSALAKFPIPKFLLQEQTRKHMSREEQIAHCRAAQEPKQPAGKPALNEFDRAKQRWEHQQARRQRAGSKIVNWKPATKWDLS